MSRNESGAPDSGGQGVTLNRLAALITADTAGTLGLSKLSAGTLPTTATFGTANTATNNTETRFVADDRGVHLTVASATATARTSGRMTTGTRIAAYLRGGVVSTGTTGVIDAGYGLRLRRNDGVCLTAMFVGTNIVIGVWSSLDAYSADRLVIGGNTAGREASWMRFGQASAGANVVFEVSSDGVNWDSLYSATPTAAFGTAADATTCGIGFRVANATCTAWVNAARVTVG